MYIYICSKAFHMHVSLPLSIYMYTGLGHWPVMAQRDDCLHGTAPYTHVYIYIYILCEYHLLCTCLLPCTRVYLCRALEHQGAQ